MIQKIPSIAVVALGNDLLGDDGIALAAIRELQKDLPAGVAECVEFPTGGFALLDCLEGRDSVILLDSVMTGKISPGTILTLDPGNLPTDGGPPLSPHYAGLADCLTLAESLGIPVPRNITILAMEVTDPFTFSTSFSPAVQQALPEFVSALRQAIASIVEIHS